MKKLIDDLRMIQAEHTQVDTIRHKLSTYREELDRKIIGREQLMGKADVSFVGSRDCGSSISDLYVAG